MILHDYPQTLVSTNKQVIYLYVRQWPVRVETCLHQKHLVRIFYCLVHVRVSMTMDIVFEVWKLWVFMAFSVFMVSNVSTVF